jgi:hypothetical protein
MSADAKESRAAALKAARKAIDIGERYSLFDFANQLPPNWRADYRAPYIRDYGQFPSNGGPPSLRQHGDLRRIRR